MRRLALGLAACAVVAGSFGISAAPASAHPVDELVQQIYITPSTTGIDIEVQLEPGILVGPDFAAMLDVDGDGQLSTAETAGNAAAVHDAIEVAVNGQPATMSLVDSDYPALDVLTAAGGSITLQFAVNASTAGRTAIRVTNDYTPLDPSGQPFTTTIQTNLTPAIDTPVMVGAMEHADSGRTLNADYTVTSAQADTAISPTSDAGSTSTGSGKLGAALIAVVVALLAAAVWSRRRARRRISVAATPTPHAMTEISVGAS